MSITPIAQRLSRYSLKTIKRANPENLQKIKAAFGKMSEEPILQDAKAQFDVVVPKFGKKEQIRVTSDPVEGQKHPSIKATFSRGREKIETYAEDAAQIGHAFGDLLSAEVRSPHLSPQFILKSGNRVTQKTCDRYNDVLRAVISEQNEPVLGALANQGLNAKVLKNGQFRIKQATAEGKSISSLKLNKRSKQNYQEFVNDGVQYAQLLSQPLPHVSPRLALKNNRLQNVVAKDGFEKYEKVNKLFADHQAAFNSLQQIENAAFKVKGTGQLKITDAQKRSYVVDPNKSSNFEQFFEDGLAFANKAAHKNEHISTGLMTKKRFGLNRKIDLKGMKKFDEASEFFAANQPLLTELKDAGVLVKLRHNGKLRIIRQDAGRQVFKKELTHAKGQSMQDFLQAGLNQANMVAEATVPAKKPGILSGLTPKKQAPQPPVVERVLSSEIQPAPVQQADVQASSILEAALELPQSGLFGGYLQSGFQGIRKFLGV
ncbi:hypothetical protein [Vampirovibrio sp.]|uniref:hypothetical protein n=1 Tax=Vampirovibrio sp. TaxID=2717857 RepID=UPI00359426B8